MLLSRSFSKVCYARHPLLQIARSTPLRIQLDVQDVRFVSRTKSVGSNQTVTKTAVSTAPWQKWEEDLLISYVKHNGRKWAEISRHLLPHRTAHQCMQRWDNVLDPQLESGPLSKRELDLLAKGVEEFGKGKWRLIREKYLPNRAQRKLANAWRLEEARQCRNEDAQERYGWTSEEDQLVLKGYAEFGNQWTRITEKYLPWRYGAIIRQRYMEALDPMLKHEPWSETEKALLLRRALMYGQDWKKVAEGLPGRTAWQCQDMWFRKVDPNALAEPTSWTAEETRLFWSRALAFECNWVQVSKDLPGRDARMCSQKFYRDLKELQILYGDNEISIRPDETRRKWKLRIASLMNDWLQEKPIAKLSKAGALKYVRSDPESWTPEEHDKLLQRIQKHDGPLRATVWEDIAYDLGRTVAQCREEYQRILHQERKSGPWSEQEDAKLSELVGKHGARWQLIAAEFPERTATQCLQRWQLLMAYQDGKEFGTRFSKEEQELVAQGVEMFGHNWVAIANTYLPHRTPAQCMRYWIRIHRKKGSWTEEEDKALKFAVEIYGDDWAKISPLVPGRTPRQCWERWHESLDPNVKKGEWSLDEKLQLVELVQKQMDQFGRVTSWESIAQELGTGRTAKMCRSKYSASMRSRKR